MAQTLKLYGAKARATPPPLLELKPAQRTLAIPAGIDAMSIQEAALVYAEAGMYVLPVKRGTKHPGSLLGDDWPTKSSRDSDTIRAWFKRWPTANLGIHPGRSGLLVFDLDKAESLTQLPANIAADLRLAAFQRSRGQDARGHYVFADALGSGNTAGGWAPWGEVRGKNGFIMAAPSIHPDTREPYWWAKDGVIPEVPSGLRALIGASSLDFAPAMTAKELDGFLDAYTADASPERLDVMVHAFRGRVEDGEARHTAMQGALVGAFRDARNGLYPARRAFETFRDEYRSAFRNSGSRVPSPGEFEGMAEWAAAQPSVVESAGQLWKMTRQLRTVHEAAFKWGVSPYALLAEGLLRALVAAPPSWYLPGIVGSPAPVNLFLAIVGPSGAGKGIAGSLADLVFVQSDPFTVDDTLVGAPGSGEGIPAMYGRYVAKVHEVVYKYSRVYAKFGEVDQLGGMQARKGSTLDALLREVWSGARVGNTTNDATRSNQLASGRYRFVMSVGVQPERAGTILDGESGGLPQRFLWVMATDPDLPMASAEAHEDPPQIVLPRWEFDPELWRAEMGALVPREVWRQNFSVPPEIVLLVRVARHAASHGQVAAIDGHRLLLMEKVALAFAILHGRRDGFGLEHWEMAERLMLHSDAALQTVRAGLRDAARREAEARSTREGRGEVIRSDAADAELRDRCRKRIVTLLGALKSKSRMAGADIRRQVSVAQKSVLEDVLAGLVKDGTVARRRATSGNSTGFTYRLSESK